jgi:hypothetical protein
MLMAQMLMAQMLMAPMLMAQMASGLHRLVRRPLIHALPHRPHKLLEQILQPAQHRTSVE